MFLIKKFLAVCLLALLFLSPAALAETQEVTAEGEYRLGDRDNRETAKEAALADAKRKIAEQVGVLIKSYSEVNNFKLTKDEIKTIAQAIFKLKGESVDYIENGTVCKVVVIALIDTDSFDTLMRDVLNNNASQTHRYKVFNEGLTWQDAVKRCESLGGHLATITSEQEQSEIYKLLMQDSEKHAYWLGGFRNRLGNWEWITGEPFTYANWAYGEPNNANGVEDIITILGARNRDKFWFATWNDLGSDGSNHPYFGLENFGFICEWEG